MSSAASAPVNAPSGPSFTKVWSAASEQYSVIKRVLTDQYRCDIARDDAERSDAASIGDASPIPDKPSSVEDPHKGAALPWLVLRRPGDLGRLRYR